jgi:hypothetical protein
MLTYDPMNDNLDDCIIASDRHVEVLLLAVRFRRLAFSDQSLFRLSRLGALP